MMFVYIIAVAIIILHFENKMRSILNSIEQRRNIADLLFLKQLLDFIYNSNIIPDIGRGTPEVMPVETGSISAGTNSIVETGRP